MVAQAQGLILNFKVCWSCRGNGPSDVIGYGDPNPQCRHHLNCLSCARQLPISSVPASPCGVGVGGQRPASNPSEA